MKLTIIGGGAYALAISKVLCDNKNKVFLFTKVNDEYEKLKMFRKNERAILDYKIDDMVFVTNDLEEAIRDSVVIFIAVSLAYVKSTLEEMKPYIKKSQHICLACKGIDDERLLFPYELANKILKTKNISIITGGTFAKDMVEDLPLALTLASDDRNTIDITKKCLDGEFLKVSVSHDVFGCEMWGAIKNVVAICCGMVDGMMLSSSTKSMMITKFVNDCNEMIDYFGGNKNTFFEYAGIGDLWLTCNSLNSRNYTLGLLIGKKDLKKDEYIKNNTTEGLYTLKSLYNLFQKEKYQMEFINIMYEIIYLNKDINYLLEYLRRV